MKKWRILIPILLAILILSFLNGYRITALGAAKSTSEITRDAELMERYEMGSSVIFLFKNDKEKMYRAVLSEKSGMLFVSKASTYIPYSSDLVQTVGGMSFTKRNNEASFLSVISYDEEVAYIEAGVEPNVERKEVKKGERISFLFPYSEQIDLLSPAAFNKDGKKLYYYGYPTDTNVFKSEDFKWHKID